MVSESNEFGISISDRLTVIGIGNNFYRSIRDNLWRMYGIHRYLDARSFDIHEGIIGIVRKFFAGESEMGFIDCNCLLY